MHGASGRRLFRHRQKTNSGSEPWFGSRHTRRERAGSYGKSGNVDGMCDPASELVGLSHCALLEMTQANARAAIAIAVTEIFGVLVIGTSLKVDGS